MLEIVKSFKKLNPINMARNYELKRGVLLQEFGHPEKACTNDTLTDELAEWHLSRHPEKSVLFARLPGPITSVIHLPPPEIKIIKPAQTVIIPPAKIAQEDPVKRKLLVDKALELGFKSSPENPIELITSEELNVIIPNLEKAKEILEKKEVEKPKNKSGRKPKARK